MKGLGSLLFLVFYFVASAPMTVATPAASPDRPLFNNTLSEGGHKSTPRPSNDIRLVVIDAGHGGKDPGGLGRNCREKDIALNVARLLRNELEARYPTIEFVLTRTEDTFIPLADRAGLANAEGADLFISIHANIARTGDVYGTETFVMGDHVHAYNLEVAKRENAVIEEYENNADERYGLDPFTNEGHIMLSHLQAENFSRSITFAGLVENAFAASGRKSRGVKQAGFVVLKRATMPAVLVELGFMSNNQEEAYLMSASGQQSLASSIAEAFTRYKTQIGGGRELAFAALPVDAETAISWKADDVSETAIIYKDAPELNERIVAPVIIPAAVQQPDRVQTILGLQLAVLSKPADYRALGWHALPYSIDEVRVGDAYHYQIRDLVDGRAVRQIEVELKLKGIDCIAVAYRGEERLRGEEFRTAMAR